MKWEEDEGNGSIRFGCDTKGETLDNWTNNRILIERDDMDMLLSMYHGKFGLNAVLEVWNELFENFMGFEEI
jgi:hypothetical protein